MSRSFKKHPIGSNTTAESERAFKQAEHQRERHHVRQRLRVALDETDRVLNRARFGDPWRGPKDGKQYFGRSAGKVLRK